MTKETQKLFAAPWKTMPEDHGIVQDVNGAAVAICVSPEVANAFSRLPELYDALLQATEDACRTCNHEKAEGMLDRPCADLHANECYVAEWRELLKKVRDGEK